ncbi:MAG TPA: acetate kinase [Thermoanaerobaculaceae bacterium]|nr:acetate kinase [Thermoanaerobaculaceae bacterium]HRS16445.1 acetate kinase [Thermoanaerobaculaceae bacterium]
MKVLVLNCGSSSVKFQLVETDETSAAAGRDRALAKGIVENIGGLAILRYEAEGRKPLKETGEILEHKIAVERILGLLTREDVGVLRDRREIDAVGHRMVHGGERFKTSALIDDDVLSGIEDCIDLAPLHNPPNIKGYRAARELLAVPHVAVFDTSFHQTMPAEAYLYGVPYVLYQRHGVRRYGFHGTSHRFVSRRMAEILGRVGDPTLRVITCHLGNGCSITAIRGGRSVDTSMGLTPLEGLLMGTRAGDIDAGLVLHVMTVEELGISEANALLNKHSGLLGISGVSNDMRALLQAESEGNERARAALDVFCYRLKKYIAAYVGVLGGVDAVVFTGGIGENAAPIRARSVAGLEAIGLRLDPERNAAARAVEAEVSADGSPGKIWVIPTNEELLIARDTMRIVSGLPPE